MTLPHLPGKLAKIGRKNSSRFQIVGIQDHAKTRFIAGFQSSEIKNGRTDVSTNIYIVCKQLHSYMSLRGDFSANGGPRSRQLGIDQIGLRYYYSARGKSILWPKGGA
jgi:hypothetical protein